MQVRTARPTADLEQSIRFYRDLVGFTLLASFEDHAGFSGAIFGMPDESRQLEIVSHVGVLPTPTTEDQLVLYLGSTDAVSRLAQRLIDAGVGEREPSNPYWKTGGARCFTDVDGYWLILSPSSW
jgi:catechol 2,3-dioxygenase-like lactoylglutathione lyase family enzyme